MALQTNIIDKDGDILEVEEDGSIGVEMFFYEETKGIAE